MMSKKVKQTLRQEYDRLKKVVDKILNPGKEEARPQLVLQPIRNQPHTKHLK